MQLSGAVGKFHDVNKSSITATLLSIVFSHLGLCTLVALYALFGAWIFQMIEQPVELEKLGHIKNDTINVMLKIREFVESRRSTDFRQFSIAAEEILKDYERKVVFAVNQEGYDGDDEVLRTQWTFSGALLYSITVFTTIGYGNIAPKTTLGRMVTILYATIGIPLMLLCLANIAEALAQTLTFIYFKICCAYCRWKKNRRRVRRAALSFRAHPNFPPMSHASLLFKRGPHNRFVHHGRGNIRQASVRSLGNTATGGRHADSASLKIVGGVHKRSKADHAWETRSLPPNRIYRQETGTDLVLGNPRQDGYSSGTPSPQATNSPKLAIKFENSPTRRLSPSPLCDQPSKNMTENTLDDSHTTTTTTTTGYQSVGFANNGHQEVAQTGQSVNATISMSFGIGNNPSKQEPLCCHVPSLIGCCIGGGDCNGDDVSEHGRMACDDVESDDANDVHGSGNGVAEEDDKFSDGILESKMPEANSHGYIRTKKQTSNRSDTKPHPQPSNHGQRSPCTVSFRNAEDDDKNVISKTTDDGQTKISKNDFSTESCGSNTVFLPNSIESKPSRKIGNVPLDPQIEELEVYEVPNIDRLTSTATDNLISTQSNDKSSRRMDGSVARDEVWHCENTATKLCDRSLRVSDKFGTNDSVSTPSSTTTPAMGVTGVGEETHSINFDLQQPKHKTSRGVRENYFHDSHFKDIISEPGVLIPYDKSLVSPAGGLTITTPSDVVASSMYGGPAPYFSEERSDAKHSKTGSDEASLRSIRRTASQYKPREKMPVSVGILIVLGFIVGGSVLFAIYEQWNMFDGAYFCFVTMTTIGFGDLVPGDALKGGSQEALTICSVYLLVGMALIAMCFKLMQDDVIQKTRWLGQKIGLLVREDNYGSDSDFDFDDEDAMTAGTAVLAVAADMMMMAGGAPKGIEPTPAVEKSVKDKQIGHSTIETQIKNEVNDDGEENKDGRNKDFDKKLSKVGVIKQEKDELCFPSNDSIGCSAARILVTN